MVRNSCGGKLFVPHWWDKDALLVLYIGRKGFCPTLVGENHPKHKKKDMSLEELVGHMKIEEANRLKDKDSSPYELSVKANIVESSVSKHDRFNKQNKVAANQGHKAWQCYNRKDASNNGQKSDQNKNQAHIAEESDDVIAAVVSEINLVGNKAEWVVETGATKHFCSEKDLFIEFHEFSKADQGYLSGGLFILETVFVAGSINKASTSAYIVENFDLWHARLGHVNYGSMKRLQKMSLIASLVCNGHKCGICVEAKHCKKPFKPVLSRQTELLELVHSDLADFKNIES
ncbi:uncharacterized protein LOC130813420 [Amaranthus tricolor]|uniref:uncharacterized protein LOC130813420 n=1 Tax=Amaranthus tricolor TaxID=29722 RepID=UPI00258BF661|nr:uncharacterized protein LOC130813420 [Amaranthus tricolor]